jgi:hypothetical protein
LALALMVEEKGEKLRMDYYAYSERPSPELLINALRVLAKELDKTSFEVVNEPECSEMTEILSKAGRRRSDLSQKYMSIRIEHK